MKARTAIVPTAHRVRLTAVGWGLMTMLACVALAACTSSPPSSPSSTVTVLSPTASPSATATATATASSTASPTATPSVSASASPSVSHSVSPAVVGQSGTPSNSPSLSPYYYPTPALATGGGGTAGFEDAWLAVLGSVAIVTGLGSIAYRRRITRNR